MCIQAVVLSLAVLGVVVTMSSAMCPRIVSRSEWQARPAKNSDPLEVNPPTHVVIHHSASSSCSDQNECSALVRAFQNYHMDNNGWDDIGYNFLVGEDGNVYEGRGWGITGAHAPGYNTKSIGICVIGTYTSRLPNAAALQAVDDLIACSVTLKKLTLDYLLLGHRQARATECPGNVFYKEITTWPHWTPNPESSISAEGVIKKIGTNSNIKHLL